MKHSSKTFGVALAIGIGVLSTGTLSASASAAVDGKAVFEKNCSVCHSVTPPPKSAPPILPISARYHQRFSSRSEGIKYMADFIKSPTKEKVLADQQAITRFGLMPPIPLSAEELNAVSAWVWDQYTGGSWRPGRGQGRGAGQGNCYQQ
ncbi:cytochrome c [Chlorobaculum sp. 24CR]|uniref:c-type cytochrome n=1 Tax=Chlorobaculum sp. 24CR TaxID=2508878 RepID=UPI00100B9DCF|nr:cytochrome c [Chlorobaculum sp. 24CR]RXK82303.1 cytochrome c [Chlorobaculum sp. 24CR]